MTEGDNQPEEQLAPWERNRRLRQAQIEAEQEHGRRLGEHYGWTDPRARFAYIGHVSAKRRRLRR